MLEVCKNTTKFRYFIHLDSQNVILTKILTPTYIKNCPVQGKLYVRMFGIYVFIEVFK